MPKAPETIKNDATVLRVLSLDGGGAKGFYTLGILKEIEALVGRPLCESFDLIFGTSTGGIIAALLALGYGVDEIHKLYKEHVPADGARKIGRAGSPRENCLRQAHVCRRQNRSRNRGDPVGARETDDFQG